MNRNAIYWVGAFVFLVGAFIVGRPLGLYALFGVLFASFVTVWSLHSGLWHRNELTPRELSWRVFCALAGPVMLLSALDIIIQKAPRLLEPNGLWRTAVLYVAILVFSLILAGVMEAARKAPAPPSPDNRPATDL